MTGGRRAAPPGGASLRPPRLVATDLDGTLLRSDGTVSARTAAALAAVEEAGVHVVFVTARPPRWVDLVAEAVGGHGVVLCLNGAVVYDARARSVVEHVPIDDDVVRAVVADLRTHLPSVTFALERTTGMSSEHAFVHLHPTPDDHRAADAVEALLDGTTGKLLARCADVADDALVARVEAVLDGRAVVADSGAPGLAEITAAGVTKGAALTRWSAARGVAAQDVWAFGDMPNDLPMLGWAGHAVAVANAHPSVLAVADEVTGSNDDDGVAQVLERLLGDGVATLGDGQDS